MKKSSILIVGGLTLIGLWGCAGDTSGDHLGKVSSAAETGDSSVVRRLKIANPPEHLQNGVPVSALSAAEGEELLFTIQVPPDMSRLVVGISGGSGDADLYLNPQVPPTSTSYQCRPYLHGNEEICTADKPVSGTWFVMIRAYVDFSDLTLRAAFGGDYSSGELAPRADFSFSVSDETVTFTNRSYDPDGFVVSWHWLFGDGYESTEENPTHVYSSGGTYSVRLIVTDNTGMTAATTKAVSVGTNLSPVAFYTYSSSGGSAAFEDESHDRDGTVEEWFWSFGDGSISVAQHPNHTYDAAGVYTVSLTVTDDRGARDTMTAEIKVSADACPLQNVYSGSLSGAGDYDLHPNGTYLYLITDKLLEGYLEGPAGTDFDLYLYRWTGLAGRPLRLLQALHPRSPSASGLRLATTTGRSGPTPAAAATTFVPTDIRGGPLGSSLRATDPGTSTDAFARREWSESPSGSSPWIPLGSAVQIVA